MSVKEKTSRVAGRRGGAADWSGLEVLAFESMGRFFAVQADPVAEIFPIENLTPVPLAPPGLQGLTYLRGATYPCIDLIGLTTGVPCVWHQHRLYGVRIELAKVQFAVTAWKISGLMRVQDARLTDEIQGVSDGAWVERGLSYKLIDVRRIPAEMRKAITVSRARIRDAEDGPGKFNDVSRGR